MLSVLQNDLWSLILLLILHPVPTQIYLDRNDDDDDDSIDITYHDSPPHVVVNGAVRSEEIDLKLSIKSRTFVLSLQTATALLELFCDFASNTCISNDMLLKYKYRNGNTESYITKRFQELHKSVLATTGG